MVCVFQYQHFGGLWYCAGLGAVMPLDLFVCVCAGGRLSACLFVLSCYLCLSVSCLAACMFVPGFNCWCVGLSWRITSVGGCVVMLCLHVTLCWVCLWIYVGVSCLSSALCWAAFIQCVCTVCRVSEFACIGLSGLLAVVHACSFLLVCGRCMYFCVWLLNLHAHYPLQPEVDAS